MQMTSRLFTVFATDRTGQSALRAAVRDAHRAYLRQTHPEGTLVVLGGPTLDTRAEMNGTLLVVQAKSLEEVQRFLAADPYALNHLFENVEVREWRCGLVRTDILDPPLPSTPDAGSR